MCTKCSAGRYLLGNTCLDTCPDNFYPNDSLGTCVKCDSPCKTCKGSGKICTSCDSQTSSYLLFKNQCFSSCPSEISVFSQGVCLACSDNCQTCSTSFNQCTTCQPGWYLSKVDQKCYAKCPADVSVATTSSPKTNETLKQPLTCERCDPSCQKCSPFNP
jgi:hypothetical protein